MAKKTGGAKKKPDVRRATVDLNAAADEILRLAEERGVEKHFFFLTTFKRYQVQMSILIDLEKTIRGDGPLVTKEYVKGRGNIYTHPAIAAYNSTAKGANDTVKTLITIVNSMTSSEDETADELTAFLSGRL